MTVYGSLLGVTLSLLCLPAFAQNPFDFAALQSLIESRHLTSVEQVISLLPENYRQNYSLVYLSRSSQFASPKYPRIILFGPDAKFIIALSGDPSMPGFDKLETIEFQEASKSFKFREIEFSKEAKRPKFHLNPEQTCAKCHRTPLRPNWENYPFWPGAFGSDIGTLSGAEKRYLDEYQKSTAHQGRYQYLKPLSNPGEVNAGVTQSLYNLEFMQIWSSIKSSSLYPRYKYSFTAAALECLDLDEFLPKPVRKSGKGLFRTEWDHSRRIGKDLGVQFQLAHKDNPEIAKEDFGREPRTLRVSTSYHYLADRMGLDYTNWTLSREMGSENIVTPDRGIIDLSKVILTDIVEGGDPDLQFVARSIGSPPFLFLSDGFGGKGTCSDLKRASLAAFSAADCNTCKNSAPGPNMDRRLQDVPKITRRILNPPAAITQCMSCHGSASSTAPQRPFDHPDQMTAELAKSAVSRLRSREPNFRMPPGDRKLDSGDARDLERYFRGF
ncbi:MAG: hypothetical protein ACXWP5_05665 [Bdellovibrionota bacterium]